MPTTWTKWPDHDDQGAPTGRWCIGPEGGDPVAVTVAATEAQADALTAYPDTIAALEEAIKRAAVLVPLLTVGQVFAAGMEAIEAAGLDPWCMNEGLANKDSTIGPQWWLK